VESGGIERAVTFDLRSYFETSDGSRPDPKALDDKTAARHPLVAFTVLAGGDAFEGGAAPKDGLEKARAWVAKNIKVETHKAPKDLVERVKERLAKPLAANPNLVERMKSAPPIRVDIVAPNGSYVELGFPSQVLERAAGLFWGTRAWSEARIAVRREHVDKEASLVEHELAHAVFSLAFTKKEQELIYQALRPVFGHPASMDEAFAIYSEYELAGDWGDLEKRAPGVYGFARRQWSENHVFTRFMRKLWFPAKPLAGPRPAIDGHRNWNKFSGSR
jgi:hypothetical protein